MASYRGSPFEAGIGPTDNDIVLFAACPPPEELGFEPATGHWRKQLRFADVQAVWQSRPVGRFRGEPCIVLDDLGDRLHIGYQGHDEYKAGELGYWQVDRGVFEVVAPRSEVTEVAEERTEYVRPGRSASKSARPTVSAGASPAGAEWPSSPVYPVQRRPDSAAYTIPAAASRAAGDPGFGHQATEPAPNPGGMADRPGYVTPTGFPATDHRWPEPLVPDETTGVALPAAAEAPLPLEAEALRAASASRRARSADAIRSAVLQPTVLQPADGLRPADVQPPAANSPTARQSSGTPVLSDSRGSQHSPLSPEGRPGRPRMATERLFVELASMAGIPASSYAVGEEADGALCLVPTGTGFEVFHCAGGARHEVQTFATEESACFYLFGVLAAEAVRTGALERVPTGRLA